MKQIKLLSDHLAPNPRRKLGAQNGTLVPCRVSKNHGHYPAGEQCPLCEPASALPATSKCLGQRYYEWFVSGAGPAAKLAADEWSRLTPDVQYRWQHDAERVVEYTGKPVWADDDEIDFGWPD